MHRVFCATPVEFEDERETFYQVLGEFNEQKAMPQDVLLIAVSIVPQTMPDKRVYQRAIDDNIRQSTYYLLVWNGDWGPPQRNFERDWNLALECVADSQSPMREAVMLRKENDYKTLDGFKAALRSRLEQWLAGKSDAV
jgi:hypothetical protein